MAQKRMFDKAIIDTDRFMDLSMPSKALYFLLGMEADDEGFVSYKKVMRIHGGNEDDIKVLIAKNFIIPFASGVVVITDWNKNNWIDSRRSKPTEYRKEKALLQLTESKEYVLSSGLASIEESRVEESSNTAAAEPSSAGRKPKFTPLGAEVVKAFEKVDPKNKTYYANKTQRAAADYLIAEYGLDEVLKRISVLDRTNKLPYFPKINSPSDLKEKWVKLQDAVEAKRAESKKPGKDKPNYVL